MKNIFYNLFLCFFVLFGYVDRINGWYNQDLVWGPNFSYGKPILYVQLDITYSDGSVLTVATDEAGNGLLVLF